MRQLLFLAFFCIFLSVTAFAEGTPSPFLQKSREAFQKNDRKKSDFYLARYLALPASDRTGDAKEFEAFLGTRKLEPHAFISEDWDKDFIEWFASAPNARWAAPEDRIREKARSFEIANAVYRNKYFATAVASPEIELWHTVKSGVVSRPLVLAMGSASDRPTLFFGRIFKDAPSFQYNPLYLNVQRHSLHHLWKPEFFDLDKDGVPEVWLRYELTQGNGFSQVLEVYRIQNDSELALLKRFQTGPDGIARRLPDGRVETGLAVTDPNNFSGMNYDHYHFQTWQYHGSAFEKTSEDNRPFILKTPDWRTYFLE